MTLETRRLVDPGASEYVRHGGIPCRLGQLRLRLDPDDRAMLDGWIHDRVDGREDGEYVKTSEWVLRQLREQIGFYAAKEAVWKHRRGDCVWCRVNVG